MSNTLVYGVGVNDADYPVKPVIHFGSKKRKICPYYQKWKSMLERCYSEKYQAVQPTYKGCKVCDEWLVFSNFKAWVISNNIEDISGYELDKDLLKAGNKTYSKENCILVPMLVNRFLVNAAYKKKSNCMLGSSFSRDRGKYAAYCQNPFTGKGELIGFFECDLDAHLAWKNRKHELACQLAELQTDERVANALRTKYL